MICPPFRLGFGTKGGTATGSHPFNRTLKDVFATLLQKLSRVDF